MLTYATDEKDQTVNRLGLDIQASKLALKGQFGVSLCAERLDLCNEHWKVTGVEKIFGIDLLDMPGCIKGEFFQETRTLLNQHPISVLDFDSCSAIKPSILFPLFYLIPEPNFGNPHAIIRMMTVCRKYSTELRTHWYDLILKYLQASYKNITHTEYTYKGRQRSNGKRPIMEVYQYICRDKRQQVNQQQAIIRVLAEEFSVVEAMQRETYKANNVPFEIHKKFKEQVVENHITVEGLAKFLEQVEVTGFNPDSVKSAGIFLAKALEPFGMKAKNVKVNGQVKRAYVAKEIQKVIGEAFALNA